MSFADSVVSIFRNFCKSYNLLKSFFWHQSKHEVEISGQVSSQVLAGFSYSDIIVFHWTLKWTFCFNIFSIVPNSRHSTLPFSRFISSLLLSNQSADSFKSFVSKLLTVEISFEATYMSVSFAYFKSLLYLIILAMSLKKMMKNNEPNNDLCGTFDPIGYEFGKL